MLFCHYALYYLIPAEQFKNAFIRWTLLAFAVPRQASFVFFIIPAYHILNRNRGEIDAATKETGTF
jgi:hypothetical protein